MASCSASGTKSRKARVISICTPVRAFLQRCEAHSADERARVQESTYQAMSTFFFGNDLVPRAFGVTSTVQTILDEMFSAK